MAAIDAACENGARAQRDRLEGQAQLFGGADETAGGETAAVPLPLAPPWTESEQLSNEKETLGLYWSGHPVDRFLADLREFGARTTGELADQQPAPAQDSWGPGGRKPIEPDTSVGGVIATCRQLKTKKGDRMAVFNLEDAEGSVEVVVFPEAYQRAASLIEAGTLVLVRGKLQREDESTKIQATEITPLDTVRERVAREVAIRVRMPATRSTFEALGEVFARHRGDRRISFELELPTHVRLRVKADVISPQFRVRPSSALIAEVEQIVGAGSVSLR
jgi:DNA polymerase-3 subunit alpha